MLRGVELPHFVRPSGSLRLAISAALRFARLLARPGGKLADQVFVGIFKENEGDSIPKILLLNINGYASSRFDCRDGLSNFIVNRQRGFRLQADNERVMNLT